MLTSIDSVLLNGEEFSRYDSVLDRIRARALFTPTQPAGGEELKFTLYRDNGYAVASKTIALTSADQPKGVVVEFDLNGSEMFFTPDESLPGVKFYGGEIGP